MNPTTFESSESDKNSQSYTVLYAAPTQISLKVCMAWRHHNAQSVVGVVTPGGGTTDGYASPEPCTGMADKFKRCSGS